MNVTLKFAYNINVSLQVGDAVYYCPNESRGGFDTVDNESLPGTGIVYIGKCVSIDISDVRDDEVVVEIDPSLSTTSTPTLDQVRTGMDANSFIMFSKNTQANLSNILGYYAETTFINDSPHKAELFAVSTEFSESSK